MRYLGKYRCDLCIFSIAEKWMGIALRDFTFDPKQKSEMEKKLRLFFHYYHLLLYLFVSFIRFFEKNLFEISIRKKTIVFFDQTVLCSLRSMFGEAPLQIFLYLQRLCQTTHVITHIRISCKLYRSIHMTLYT